MSREQFEQALKSKFDDLIDYRICKNGDGEYMVWDTQVAWFAWQAATKQAEAKCAALAAENAKKSRCLGFFSSVIKSGESWTRFCQHEYNEAQETPATDAFLAEVRASAVDEACLKIINAIVNCYQDEQIGLDAAATICGDFAAQLRQEAQ